jgi:hypothetical protein
MEWMRQGGRRAGEVEAVGARGQQLPSLVGLSPSSSLFCLLLLSPFSLSLPACPSFFEFCSRSFLILLLGRDRSESGSLTGDELTCSLL